MRSDLGPGGTIRVEIDGVGISWWQRRSADGVPVYMHGGNYAGQSSGFFFVPERGFAMTLLDSARGCAIHTTLARGERYTSLETKVNFIRPITSDTGRVRCEASVVHRGERIPAHPRSCANIAHAARFRDGAAAAAGL